MHSANGQVSRCLGWRFEAPTGRAGAFNGLGYSKGRLICRTALHLLMWRVVCVWCRLMMTFLTVILNEYVTVEWVDSSSGCCFETFST